MTLNLQEHQDHGSPIVISDDEDTEHGEASESELEEGEEREDTTAKSHKGASNNAPSDQAQQDGEVSFIVDPTPGTAQLCLRDLGATQLEGQIRYAFWQLPRDEIDLSRPVRCLHCQAEGHIDEACPAKICHHCSAYAQHESVLCPIVKRCHRCRQPGHESCEDMRNTTIPCDICTLPGHTEDSCPIKHYNRTALRETEELELWISCCACASKSHLVGDCREVPPSHAARWSLRLLDPKKIVNLSIQNGTEKREREAENRNMRPEGIRIRGRANLHYADIDRRDPDDSDEFENFFSHPPPQDRRRHELPNRPPPIDPYRSRAESRHERYDRYDAPTNVYRPPRNDYYATDSFGKPRSRSPPRYDQRPYGDSRPQSPLSYNSYRFSDEDATIRRSSPPPGDNPFKRHRQDLPPRAQQLPSRGFSIQLPTRKGSNPNLQNGSSANPQWKPPPPGQAGSAKNSNKRNNNGGQLTKHQVKHNGFTKSEHNERRQYNKKKKNKNKGAT